MESKQKPSHSVSTALFVIGGLMAFVGFVFPGWVWLLNTPGDVEMLPLAAITLVGIVGVISLVAGGFRRLYEHRAIRMAASAESATTRNLGRSDEGAEPY